MPDEAEHRYRFAAIDRASRWVYVEVQPDKTAVTAAGFLDRLHTQAPFHLRTVLTDNGKAFTDRFCATGEREPTGQHRFDQTCAQHAITHRLIKPKHPQTNGMIECFNGRIAEILKTTTFASAQPLQTTLEKYLHLYNQSIPQKNLGHVTPMTKLKEYYTIKPELFQKIPTNHPGPDNIAARRIWLNLELIKKPTRCLEYIIVHELTHLIERNHTARFKALMDGYLPHWRLIREELNRTPLGYEERRE